MVARLVVSNPAAGKHAPPSVRYVPCAKGSLKRPRYGGRRVTTCCPKGYFKGGKCYVSLQTARKDPR